MLNYFLDFAIVQSVLSNLAAAPLTHMMFFTFALLVANMKKIWRYWRAFNLRRDANDSFCVVICDFVGPGNDGVQKLIAANVEVNYAAVADVSTPVSVVLFPLAINTGASEASRQKSLKTAIRWLEKTGGDVLIWGDAIDGRGISIIRILTRSQTKTLSPRPRQVEVTVAPGDFNDQVADAITQEIAAASSLAYSQPTLVSTERLRRIAAGTKLLLQGNLPGVSDSSRAQIRNSGDAILFELSARADSISDWDLAVSNAKERLEAIGAKDEPVQWIQAATRLLSHIRRRAWAGMSDEDLSAAIQLAGHHCQCASDMDAAILADEIKLEEALLRHYATRSAAQDYYLDYTLDWRGIIDRAEDKRRFRVLAVALIVNAIDLDHVEFSELQDLDIGQWWSWFHANELEVILQCSLYIQLTTEMIISKKYNHNKWAKVIQFSRDIASDHIGRRNLASRRIAVWHARLCKVIFERHLQDDHGFPLPWQEIIQEVDQYSDTQKTDFEPLAPWLSATILHEAALAKMHVAIQRNEKRLAETADDLLIKAISIAKEASLLIEDEILASHAVELNSAAARFYETSYAYRALEIIPTLKQEGAQKQYYTAYALWAVIESKIARCERPLKAEIEEWRMTLKESTDLANEAAEAEGEWPSLSILMTEIHRTQIQLETLKAAEDPEVPPGLQ